MARTSSNTPSSAERNDPAPPPPEYMSVCPPHHLQAQAAKSDDIPPSPPDYASICPPHHVQASVAAQHSSSAPPLYSSQCPAGHVMGSPSQSMSSPSPSLAVAAPYYPVPTASSSDDSNRSVGDSGGFSQNVKQQVRGVFFVAENRGIPVDILVVTPASAACTTSTVPSSSGMRLFPFCMLSFMPSCQLEVLCCVRCCLSGSSEMLRGSFL